MGATGCGKTSVRSINLLWYFLELSRALVHQSRQSFKLAGRGELGVVHSRGPACGQIHTRWEAGSTYRYAWIRRHHEE